MGDLFAGSYAVPAYIAAFLIVVAIVTVVLLWIIDWDPHSGD